MAASALCRRLRPNARCCWGRGRQRVRRAAAGQVAEGTAVAAGDGEGAVAPGEGEVLGAGEGAGLPVVGAPSPL